MTDQTLRALLVEDNPGDARLTSLLLEECSAPAFEVSYAASVAAALAALGRQRCDVILLDLNLPDSEGLQGLRAIVRSGYEVPIIVLTGLDDEEVGVEAIRSHAADYLVKGKFDSATLARAVRYAISRARAEQELLLQHSALVSAANAIVMTRADGAIQWVNPAFTALTGYEADEVLGKNPRVLKSGRHPASFYGEMWKTVLAGRVWHGEVINKRKDGTLYTEEMTITPVRGAGGAITHFIAIKQDVSERKRSEAALADALGQTRRRTEEVTALLTASRAVLERRSFPAAAKAIFESCKALVGAAAGYVALSEPGASAYDLVYFDSGGLECTVDVHLPMPIRGLRGEAYRTRRTVFANDFSATPWTALLPPGHVAVDNVLFAPLVVGDQVRGVLGLSSKPGGFTEDDVRLTTAFAEMASVALLNSRSLEFLERNQEMLEAQVEERTRQLRESNEALREENAERRQAEAQLRFSDQRFRELFENVFDGVYEVDTARTVRNVNSALVRMLGFASKEELAREVEAGRIWQDPEAAESLWRELVKAASLRGVELSLRRRDGSLLRALTNVDPVVDDSGAIVGYQGTVFDVTALKQAEETLSAERARLFGVLHLLPLFVYLRRADGSVVFVNRHFLDTFGNPDGRKCYEVLSRRDTPCAGCDFHRVFTEGEWVEWEWTSPSGDSYEVHHFPFVDSDGTRLVLALGVNVTERKRAYEAEQRARRTADTLREASLGLTRSLDVDTVLLSLLEDLRRLIPFDRAKVMLVTNGHLAVRAVLDSGARPQPVHDPRPTFPVADNPVIEEIVSTRRPILVSDIHEHPVFGRNADPSFEHCWLGVPLVARNRVIGLYSLGKREAASIGVEHQRIAEALAAQAAVAIENALLFEEVQLAGARLRALSRHLVEVQETERRTIARELHDEAGQSLTSILFGLRLLEKELGGHGAAARVGELKRTTDAVMEDLHRLAAALRPASLEHLGLVAALRQHVGRVEATSGLKVRFMAHRVEDARLPGAVETTLFRIVQEALTNVVRHAQATRVDVLVERRDDRVVVVVEDNGVGFDSKTVEDPERLGRVGMMERAEALGGTLTLESAPGAGTTVVVEVPCGDSSSDSR
jgi:PAS domain S-box-containing protein